MSAGENQFNYVRRYTSVAACVDWFAMSDDGSQIRFEPIVAWATTRDSDGGSSIVGMVVDTEFQELAEAGDIPGFAGYFSRKYLDDAAANRDAVAAAHENHASSVIDANRKAPSN